MREMKDSGIEWIGEIPKIKRIIRNKYLLEYTKGKLPVDTNFEGNGFPYIGATDLDSNEPCKTYTSDETLPDSCDSDLLVLWDGARAGLCGTHKVGKVSSTIVRIREVDSTIYRPFLYWYYKGFENYMYQRVNGTTIPHMNRKYIEEIQMIDWTIQEQRRIADYLDRKCSQIDAIIARQQEVIEKLKAYKLSKINEIVVEVEGITAHLGYVANMKNGLNFNVVPDGKTLKFLGVGDFKDHYVLDSEEMFSDILVNDEITSEYMLQSGDIIFVRSNGSRELVGRAVMVENVTFPLSYSGFCIRFRNLRTDILNSKYLLYFFRSPYFRKQLEKYSQGSNITNINQVLLSQISIIIPPFEVQLEAIRKVEKLLAAIDKLITGKQEIVSALERYKKSLIYEVVTGKKEV